MTNLENWQRELSTLLTDFRTQANVGKGDIVIIGCSTSEVIGEKIGTAGSEDVAKMIFDTLATFKEETGVQFAFQCCEHLNRALVIERSAAKVNGFEEVTVIPVRKAGGAMATYAYQHMENPVVVEFIKADAGIDIGDTFIGMHLKHVAVPLRSTIKQIGSAHVTMAKTRPKLIGGARAVYEATKENTSCH
ncbi:TIGR01440 family protein [uncultured Metabacillus sp.]|uniref:TIGR01440 family protein n=1 Tax=uncultured Metabacillus sp. TaxID=2860135 RepID=UPI00262CE2E6|nr:TIGR01440 family protein [uncultured Metabacillus sp.]